eukprot:CCRYP_013301-RA/>CCRYP_013301-RA protein AED:0.00 eAED:0.00 QI:640/1/1/1/0.25/0/5/412/361
MSPLESKLKRSPYLSQMTRAADMQHTAAATLIRPSGTAANGDNEAVGEGGVARDFFELKRPEVLQHSADRQQRHRPSLKKLNSTSMKKATSVTFSTNHPFRSTPVSEESLHGTSSNAHAIAQQQELQMHQEALPSKPPRSNTTTPNLQYYYNAKLKSSAVALDLIKNKTTAASSRTMTFRDVLDEGDGKEGDLNLRRRNEQWKTFSETSLADEDDGSAASSEWRRKRKRPSPYARGGWVSANDLAVLRRAASRMKMSTHFDELASLSRANSSKVHLLKELGETLGGSMLSRISQDLNVGTSSELFMRNTPLIIERTHPASTASSGNLSLVRRVHTISAGLAYGSDNFRILNECKNNEILEV